MQRMHEGVLSLMPAFFSLAYYFEVRERFDAELLVIMGREVGTLALHPDRWERLTLLHTKQIEEIIKGE